MGIGFVIKAAAALAVLLAIIVVPVTPDESDAYAGEYTAEIILDINEYVEIDLQDYIDGHSFKYCLNREIGGDGSLPSGLSREGSIVSGTPKKFQESTIEYQFTDNAVTFWNDVILIVHWKVVDIPEEYTVTYDAGIGKVNGSMRWSETIVEGTYASMPKAMYTSGAYTFKGWSLSQTSSTTISSLTVTEDVTLYAVWERNTVTVNSITATIASGQSSSMPIVTNPENASVRVSDYGGLPSTNVVVSSRMLTLDMTGVQPGTYYLTLTASSSGYYNGTATVTVMVPISIVKPIEYTLTAGDVFSYTPVTNPSNASIAIKQVTIDGIVAQTDLRVSGRTISGVLTEPGTYEVTYRAYMSGYVEVTNNVIVYVSAASDVPSTGNVSLASITAASRASEPRVFDFVAIGGENVSNYVWTVDGEVFASSSPTALYEFPSSGFYTVGCTARGFDGSEVSMEITVICTDNYHREAAWSGVEYGYIVSGSVEAAIPSGAPFVRSEQTIDGRVYTMVSGTPSEGDIGKTFDLKVGDESWTVTVYKSETSAPTASFGVTVDGYKVKATFTGLHASFHRFDFDGDGVYESGDEFTYDRPGRYSVVCNAVNNISEVTSTVYVEIDIVPQEDTTLEDLTDFDIGVGERMYISIALAEGDVMSVSGSAAYFVTVEGSSLKVDPQRSGVYELTVKVTHSDGTEDSKTVRVTVKEPGQPDPVPHDDGDYTLQMVAVFVVGIGLIAAFFVYDSRTGKVSGRYRSIRSRIMNRNIAGKAHGGSQQWRGRR